VKGYLCIGSPVTLLRMALNGSHAYPGVGLRPCVWGSVLSRTAVPLNGGRCARVCGGGGVVLVCVGVLCKNISAEKLKSRRARVCGGGGRYKYL
jgi:hypothetical protein